ncbi:MAG TPA: DUF5602 domain-containing protein [Rhodocyclaceae bacterium]|nr:DUF5602 domain-containing protein [Rhodocyclaceae bacterium]
MKVTIRPALVAATVVLGASAPWALASPPAPLAQATQPAKSSPQLAQAGATAVQRAQTAAATTHEGRGVAIGQGEARTIVRTDDQGRVAAIGVVMTPGTLEGLPETPSDGAHFVTYALPMPAGAPQTVVDHVEINWEPHGHPPSGVYDIPHFDFHIYVVSEDEQRRVSFDSDQDSARPEQQPAAELLAAGYAVPPGTAVPQMGVHAIDRSGPEFNGQPFTATFIYGYYDGRLTFVEPMASLDFLKTKPSFSAPVARPAAYSVAGLYPSAYTVKYDPARDVYEITLDELR